MARYKIRRNLREKLQKVLDKAAAKEGREITHTRISMGEKLDVFAENDGYMLLADGRYAYDVWNDEIHRYERYVVDNVPVTVLEELFVCLHDEKLQERDKKENDYADRRAPWQDDDDKPQGIWDRIPAQWRYGNPEANVIRKLCGDVNKIVPADLETLGDDPVIGYSANGKRFDRQTIRKLQAIALAYTESLPDEKREQFDMLYACGAVQKDLAQYWGISEPAVSKRAHAHINKVAKIFTGAGYPVPAKAELQAEKCRIEEEQKKAREELRKNVQEHTDTVAQAITDIYFAEYDEDDETA